MNSQNLNLKDIFVELPISLKSAMNMINKNCLHIIFFVDSNMTLIGSLSDGDIRRAFLNDTSIDEVITFQSNIFNKKPVFLNTDASLNSYWEVFNSDITCIPLIDSNNKVIDFSTPDLVRRFPISTLDIGELEKANVYDCLESGWISSQGKFIPKFEKDFSDYLGGGYAIAVSNGTTALQLALVSMGIGIGDEVILPDFTFGASINAIIHAGATPVLVDINRDTWTIDLDAIRGAITKKTKAIMPVHIYGLAAELDEIKEIALLHNLRIIEDCAEALGGSYKGGLIGSASECACFSFFANKVITTGEGGMILFKDESFANKARILRDHGMSSKKRYWHEYAGFNFRLTNLQAAIGVAQLSRINFFLKLRSQLFETYNDILANLPNLIFLPKNNWSKNSFWLYTLAVMRFDARKRDSLISKLALKGIDARPGFYPLHTMEPFKKYSQNRHPNSIWLSDSSISLPSSPHMKIDEIRYIANSFIQCLSELSC